MNIDPKEASRVLELIDDSPIFVAGMIGYAAELSPEERAVIVSALEQAARRVTWASQYVDGEAIWIAIVDGKVRAALKPDSHTMAWCSSVDGRTRDLESAKAAAEKALEEQSDG